MNVKHKMIEPVQTSDREFTNLCESITDRLLRSESVDFEKLVEEHPVHESALREFFPVMKAMAEMGLSVSRAREPELAQPESDVSQFGTLGDFRIEEEIGRGGMGIVYRARQISLDRTVALKVLPYVSVLDERQIARFKNEAKAAARLKHPNIVSVHSVGCERGVHYYAMELVDGESLTEVIRQIRESTADSRHRDDNGSASETRSIAALSTDYTRQRQNYYRAVARLGIQAAEALQYAHDEGIVHRDIKPSNLMVDGHGKLWVTDFGLAQIEAEHSLTMTGDVLGTLRYMSPEQAQGRNGLDERTDVYSLGLSLYEMATLRPAFDGKDRATLTRQVTESEPRSPRKLEFTIPVDLETIILRAVAHRPDDRFDTAQELADDLKRYLDHKPIRAKKASRTQHVLRWARRNPAFATLVGLLLCGLAFLAVAGPAVAVRQTGLLARERHRAYVEHVNLAHETHQYGDYRRVEELLNAYEQPIHGMKDLRGFGWYYLMHQIKLGEQTPVYRWWININDVKFSPNGDSIVFGSWDGSLVVLRNSSNLSVVHENRGRRSHRESHGDSIRAIAYSADGNLFATTTRDGMLRLWSAETSEPKLLDEVKLGMEGTDVDISMEGFVAVGLGSDSLLKRMPSTEPARIRMFRIAPTIDGNGSTSQLDEVCDLEDATDGAGRVRSVDFSPDGQTVIASCDDGAIRRWNIHTHESLPALAGHDGPVMDTEFSHDGQTIVSCGGVYHERQWIAGEVNLWDVHTGRRIRKFNGHTAGVLAVSLSPDGELVASGGADRSVCIWNVKSGELQHTFQVHANWVTEVNFSPDGKHLVSVGKDGQVRLWALTEVTARQRIVAHETDLLGMAFTPDSRSVVTASADRTIKIWDIRTGKLAKHFTTEDKGLSFAAISPDGRRLASGGHYVLGKDLPTMMKLWDLHSGKELAFFSNVDQACWEGTFSPDGKVLATSGGGGNVKFWDPETGNLVRTLSDAHEGDIYGLAFTPDGQYLVTCGVKDGHVKLWDCKTFLCVHPFEQSEADTKHIYRLALSQDGRYVAAARAESVWLLDIARHEEIGHLKGQSGIIISVSFSRDGKHVASGSSDGSVTLWDVELRSQLMTWRDHPGWVWHVEFSPDGKTLASGCSQGILCLRRAPGLQ